MNNLISVTEAAKRLGCSRGHVYDLIAKGRLTRHNIALVGSKTRISEDDLARYIASTAQPVKDAS